MNYLSKILLLILFCSSQEISLAGPPSPPPGLPPPPPLNKVVHYKDDGPPPPPYEEDVPPPPPLAEHHIPPPPPPPSGRPVPKPPTPAELANVKLSPAQNRKTPIQKSNSPEDHLDEEWEAFIEKNAKFITEDNKKDWKKQRNNIEKKEAIFAQIKMNVKKAQKSNQPKKPLEAKINKLGDMIYAGALDQPSELLTKEEITKEEYETYYNKILELLQETIEEVTGKEEFKRLLKEEEKVKPGDSKIELLIILGNHLNETHIKNLGQKIRELKSKLIEKAKSKSKKAPQTSMHESSGGGGNSSLDTNKIIAAIEESTRRIVSAIHKND